MSPVAATMPGMPARDVNTTVQYLAAGSKNQRYFSKGIEVNIGDYKSTEVIIRDARPARDEYTVETAGFELVDHKSKVCSSTVVLIIDHRLLRSRSARQRLRGGNG